MGKLLEAVLATVLLLGIFQSGSSVRFEVQDAGKTCIMADLNINFTVDYKSGEKQAIASLSLPDDASVDPKSSCGINGSEPLLVIAFKTGYSLSMNFTKLATDYHIDQLVFTYNLSDAEVFPQSENGTKQVSSNTTEIAAKTNQYYKCSSPHLILMGSVNATFHNVKLEAFLSSGNYSTNGTICKEDITPTSTPTTPPRTSAPTPPPTTPSVNPKTPDTGDYKVNNSGVICIMAKMGLQLNVNYTKKDGKNVSYEFNIDPKLVNSTGNCSQNYATLQLYSQNFDLLFNFTLNTTDSKFYLAFVHLSTTVPEGKEPFVADSGSLSYLQTTTHKSFKCNSKQTFQITDSFTMNTYNLQIQAFDLDGSKFGPAVECSDDRNGMLVPIIVGAALAGLVLIVLVAYLIGRKRSHAGYQTI